ncbi:Filamin-B [Varanus komodoensis]|nr:Filamin-B [Varanus komodoensis]
MLSKGFFFQITCLHLSGGMLEAGKNVGPGESAEKSRGRAAWESLVPAWECGLPEMAFGQYCAQERTCCSPWCWPLLAPSLFTATDADDVAVLSQEPLNAACPPGFQPWVHSFLHSSMFSSINESLHLGFAKACFHVTEEAYVPDGDMNGVGFKPFDMVIPFAVRKGEITGEVHMPSGKTAAADIVDNKDGTVTVRYAPVEVGLHEMHIKYMGNHIPGFFIWHLKLYMLAVWKKRETRSHLYFSYRVIDYWHRYSQESFLDFIKLQEPQWGVASHTSSGTALGKTHGVPQLFYLLPTPETS